MKSAWVWMNGKKTSLAAMFWLLSQSGLVEVIFDGDPPASVTKVLRVIGILLTVAGLGHKGVKAAGRVVGIGNAGNIGTKTLTVIGSVVGGVIVGVAVAPVDTLEYAEGAKIEIVQDSVIAAHKAARWIDSVTEKGDTIPVVADSVDVAEYVDRGRAVYRSRSGEVALDVGDTVRAVVMVRGVVQGEAISVVANGPEKGNRLYIYNRLVVWEGAE